MNSEELSQTLMSDPTIGRLVDILERLTDIGDNAGFNISLTDAIHGCHARIGERVCDLILDYEDAKEKIDTRDAN